ncbi:helix-turn-helix domain-containing protein [Streptomyces sp. RPT161]|uniref:helix-turn-helix domain-containing protein n=1 Tax=Streptomyces sp. RPT161 TaxID=3015993 RepID=UPI0022B86F40|nr:DUF2690 domain-containing protein [Streptomyces sp. RPT161]
MTVPECERLAAGLRELKERTGLSLAGLAAATPYSKSSWDRYLKGRVLPPRQAVEHLCRLADEPPGRLLALWELADPAWSGRAMTAPPRAPESDLVKEPPGPPARSATAGRRRRWWGAVAAAVLVGGAVTGWALWHGAPDRAAQPTGAAASPPAPGCRGRDCEGRGPESMICAARPTTLGAYQARTGARLETRYSKECGAAWARLWHARIGDQVEVTAPDGRTYRAAVSDQYDVQGYVFTPMVADSTGQPVEVCLVPGAGGARECFGGSGPRSPRR